MDGWEELVKSVTAGAGVATPQLGIVPSNNYGICTHALFDVTQGKMLLCSPQLFPFLPFYALCLGHDEFPQTEVQVFSQNKLKGRVYSEGEDKSG